PDHDVTPSGAHAERADEDRGDRAAEEKAEDRREMESKKPGGAREAKLGEGVPRERHFPGNDETADDARDDRDDEAGRDRVLHELVAEKSDELVHQCVSP